MFLIIVIALDLSFFFSDIDMSCVQIWQIAYENVNSFTEYKIDLKCHVLRSRGEQPLAKYV